MHVVRSSSSERTEVRLIRAIAFDWGGIFTEGTFDSDAVRRIAVRTGVDEDRVSQTYYPLMEHFEAGEFEIAEFTARFLTESGLSMDREEFQSTFLSSGRERPEMYRVVAAIPDHYRVAVLSNNVEGLCDRVRDDERLQRVEHFLFSNELRVRKPDPRAYAALCETLDLPPEQVVFIDDNENNIAAARAYGLHGIHLRNFEQFYEEFTELFPDISIDGVDG